MSAIQQPFTATDTLGRFDVKANVDGGGQTGQAGALRLAVARALVKIDEAHRRKLRDLGLLTRDARAVERKKPGRPKARKRFQFSQALSALRARRQPVAISAQLSLTLTQSHHSRASEPPRVPALAGRRRR